MVIFSRGELFIINVNVLFLSNSQHSRIGFVGGYLDVVGVGGAGDALAEVAGVYEAVWRGFPFFIKESLALEIALELVLELDGDIGEDVADEVVVGLFGHNGANGFNGFDGFGEKKSSFFCQFKK